MTPGKTIYHIPYLNQLEGHSGCGVVQDRKACLFPLTLSYNLSIVGLGFYKFLWALID